MTIREYLQEKALGYLGLIGSEQDPRKREERLTFVNDIDDMALKKLEEYNVWYTGDSDELLNFYTKNGMIDYNADPLYTRNRKSYFWCVSSTEEDIKRTHSGQPRNIIDTLVNIVGVPKITYNQPDIDSNLQRILKDNSFKHLLNQKVLPYTLVEGWGAFKINYDTYLRDTPILLYYRAGDVDFFYKSNQLIAITYRDYYRDRKGKDYILFETRRLERDRNTKTTKLIIEKELFEMTKSDTILPRKLTDLPQLRDVEPVLQINSYNGFLGCPCIIYEDPTGDSYGRSVFTGKIDLFDDLDQCLSQASNTVRRSTVQEYFNSNYLERDRKTGMPIMPHAFDRKYVMFNGGTDENGSSAGQAAVQVTQPNLNMEQYDTQAISILLQTISGIMSPATLGIDIAKKDNAEAQREKEKVTIFTRNTIISDLEQILMKVCNELLCAYELMNRGKITVHEYDGITIKFDEFADASFEKKLETLLPAYQGGALSPELYMELLYKDTLSKDRFDRELEYLMQQQQMAQASTVPGEEGEEQPPMDQDDLGQLGAMLGGANNNPQAQQAMIRNQEFAE